MGDEGALTAGRAVKVPGPMHSEYPFQISAPGAEFSSIFLLYRARKRLYFRLLRTYAVVLCIGTTGRNVAVLPDRHYRPIGTSSVATLKARCFEQLPALSLRPQI